jgi:hypothetical protein
MAVTIEVIVGELIVLESVEERNLERSKWLKTERIEHLEDVVLDH